MGKQFFVAAGVCGKKNSYIVGIIGPRTQERYWTIGPNAPTFFGSIDPKKERFMVAKYDKGKIDKKSVYEVKIVGSGNNVDIEESRALSKSDFVKAYINEAAFFVILK